jgi:hypothetical protein
MDDTTMKWQRSSFCGDSACVEVAPHRDSVLMRDSKDPDQPYLSFSRADWNTFVDLVAAGKAV